VRLVNPHDRSKTREIRKAFAQRGESRWGQAVKGGLAPNRRTQADPGNPRRHSKKQIRQIAASIKTFGFNVPILIDRNGNVIGGHGRLNRTGFTGGKFV
jgi:hypothetical protein